MAFVYGIISEEDRKKSIINIVVEGQKSKVSTVFKSVDRSAIVSIESDPFDFDTPF